MGTLSDDLRALGYEPTERESPFEDGGRLWTKGYELVCDETGIVIDKDGAGTPFRNGRSSEVYRYRNSEKVKLVGGHVSNYEWGRDDETGSFTYERER